MNIIDAIVFAADRVQNWTEEKLNKKVDKVAGKGLSANDYTNAEKDKLSNIDEGANKTIVDNSLDLTSSNPVQNKIVSDAITNLNELVGDTAVAKQIEKAVNEIKADNLGVYVQADEPMEAEAGDIWIDIDSDPFYFSQRNLPEVTIADNGKILMVVNGEWQVVNLNLSIGVDGVITLQGVE